MQKVLAIYTKPVLVYRPSFCAQMVELVDTRDLGSRAARCAGSTPVLGIFLSRLYM